MIQREWLLWLLAGCSLLPVVRLVDMLSDVVAYSSPRTLILMIASVLLYCFAFTATALSHVVLLRRYKAQKVSS